LDIEDGIMFINVDIINVKNFQNADGGGENLPAIFLRPVKSANKCFVPTHDMLKTLVILRYEESILRHISSLCIVGE